MAFLTDPQYEMPIGLAEALEGVQAAMRLSSDMHDFSWMLRGLVTFDRDRDNRLAAIVAASGDVR